ncbi:hypothetical protein [Xanthomonas translucens]|uniref:hypothetical protein n=1 Tax=Xanthomonas campestris pv. translucens TaxID=343 RepID=UPI00071E7192|nr:hypothetical protein [Xanthomonas translucens]QEN93648.1 hypothetical protein F0H33_09895 [Xanthomonas translucens pv. undulosa]QSQ58037.1 hypothetical protein ISN37_08925 [Xanthomonas translucens pv. undulosa]WLA02813.1 hypothetical protein MO330_10010 [Xanthomonas translucens]WLA06563.1 hypothetical protein MO329_09940 [Xanthomonas translucens]
MTDLSTIVAAERDIDIKHPVTDDVIGLRITLLPNTHPQVKAAARKSLNERLAGKGKLTAEKIEQNRMDMLVASVSGWDWQGELNFQGEKPAFNEVNLRKVLKLLPWVQDQIDAELGNSADFFPS